MLSPHALSAGARSAGPPTWAAHAAEPPVAAALPRVWVLGVDAQAASAWSRSLAAEGLRVDALEVPPPAGDAAGAASSAAGAAGASGSSAAEAQAQVNVQMQALVLHAGGALAPQWALVRSLRARWPQLPLIIVAQSLRDLDQVLALEMGADDVIDAALAAPVVAARLRALWRRAAAPGADDGSEREAPRELRFGALHVRRLEREVLLAGRPVPLTEGEFEVLWLLASHAGQALSRREILKRVRGLDDQPLDRSIDSRVYRIRAKLGDSQVSPPRIRTVRHQGYAFSPNGW